MTTTQPSGAELRDRGIADALAGDLAVHRSHGDAVRETLDALIAGGVEFTADDLRRELPDDVRTLVSPAVLGSLFNTAARHGEIRCTGFAVSTTPSRRAGVLRRWVAASTEVERAA